MPLQTIQGLYLESYAMRTQGLKLYLMRATLAA